MGTEIAELNPHTLHNSSIQTLFAIEVVIDPLKLLEQSSGGQTNLRHRQKHQYFNIYAADQAYQKHKVLPISWSGYYVPQQYKEISKTENSSDYYVLLRSSKYRSSGLNNNNKLEPR